MASMVVTDASPMLLTGVTQERMVTPFIWTVQAPHRAMPQPELRPGHAEHVAQDPQQRRIAVDVGAMFPHR